MDDLSFCVRTSPIWQFIGYFLIGLKVLVPLIIIILGIVDFAKAIASNDKDGTTKSAAGLLRRFIIGVIIFLVPTLVNVVFNLLATQFEGINSVTACSTCLLDPLDDVCDGYIVEAEELMDEQIDESREHLDDIISTGGNDSNSGSSNGGTGSNSNQGTSASGTYRNTKNNQVFNLYYQNDSRWGGTQYSNGDTITEIGCMITAVSVIASAYDSSITPLTVFNSYPQSYPHTSINSLTNNNISCTNSANKSASYITEQLNQGKLAVIQDYGRSSGGSSPFTSSQHYMALLDVSGNQVYVGNGYSDSSYAKTGWFNASDVFTSVQYVAICDIN